MRIRDFELANSIPFGQFGSTSTEYGLDDMAEGDRASLVSIRWISTLDQAVTAQPIGRRDNTPQATSQGQYNIGGGITIADGSSSTQHDSVTITRADHAHSYYGLTITTGGTAPTAGRLSVFATVWEPDEHDPNIIRRFLQESQVTMAQEIAGAFRKEVQQMIDQIMASQGLPNGRR